MMNAIKTSTVLGLLLSAPFSMAGVFPVPVPLEIGGIAGVAALTLIIATQLIKRRK
jgi:hypothetical protein